TTAKLRIDNERNISRVRLDFLRLPACAKKVERKASLTLLILLIRAQPFRRLAPMQLSAQHGEMVVVLRMQQPHVVRGAAHDDTIAFGEREVGLAVAMQTRILATEQGDF